MTALFVEASHVSLGVSTCSNLCNKTCSFFSIFYNMVGSMEMVDMQVQGNSLVGNRGEGSMVRMLVGSKVHMLGGNMVVGKPEGSMVVGNREEDRGNTVMVDMRVLGNSLVGNRGEGKM